MWPQRREVPTGTPRPLERSHPARVAKTTVAMDQRDQEFLRKQLRHVPPSPRGEGTVMLALVAVFLAGMTVGALMSDYQAPTRHGAERTRTAMSVPAPAKVPIAR